jgi:hypothetical protein
MFIQILIRSPRMQGFPARFPGSIVILVLTVAITVRFLEWHLRGPACDGG